MVITVRNTNRTSAFSVIDDNVDHILSNLVTSMKLEKLSANYSYPGNYTRYYFHDILNNEFILTCRYDENELVLDVICKTDNYNMFYQFVRILRYVIRTFVKTDYRISHSSSYLSEKIVHYLGCKIEEDDILLALFFAPVNSVEERQSIVNEIISTATLINSDQVEYHGITFPKGIRTNMVRQYVIGEL